MMFFITMQNGQSLTCRAMRIINGGPDIWIDGLVIDAYDIKYISFMSTAEMFLKSLKKDGAENTYDEVNPQSGPNDHILKCRGCGKQLNESNWVRHENAYICSCRADTPKNYYETGSQSHPIDEFTQELLDHDTKPDQ